MGGGSAGQVSGASAFFRIWGNGAVADFNRRNAGRVVTVPDPLAVAAAHQLLKSESANSAPGFRIEHYAEQLNVTVEDLRELARLYGERVTSYRDKHQLNAPTIPAIANEHTASAIAQSGAAPEEAAGLVKERQSTTAIREWNVDYDTDQKEAWRETWVDFITKHFTAEQLASATVLCLPSIHAELEVRHYLKLGVRPENIYAVDHAKGEDGSRFRDSCMRLGINCFQGPLETFLMQDNPRFSIVNLDFHGQLSMRSLGILESLKFTREAIAVTNFMGCREPEGAQDVLTESVLKGTQWWRDQVRGPSLIVPSDVTDRSTIPKIIELREQMTEVGEREVYQRRQEGLAMAIWRHLGRNHWTPDWQPAAASLSGIVGGNARMAEASKFVDIAKILDDLIGSTSPRNGGISQNVMTSVLVADPMVRAAERWRYISSSGKGGRPYESTYLRISFPPRIGLGAWKVRDFAWEFIGAVDRYQRAHGHLPERAATLVSGDAYRRPSSRLQKASDLLVVSVAGETVGMISIREVLHDTNRFYFNHDRNILVFEDMTRLPVTDVPSLPHQAARG